MNKSAASEQPYSARAALLAGARDTFPLLVGALPFGIIFGALAVTSGFSPWGAAAMSAFVFAGAAQFIAVGLLAAVTPAAVIILTTFVVNLRHMLYSATLAPHLKELPRRRLLPLGFWLTDESFVVAAKYFTEVGQSPHKPWYLLGSELAMYANWQFATWIGILAGQAIQDPSSWGLDFAMVVTFVGMLVPSVKGRPALASVLVAAGAALLAYGLPHQLGLLLAALLGIIAGVLGELIWPETEPTQ
ncbi:MAG: AzlC family ABC transporter permease [Chloroflexi bacterium]|nr:AzlC family ABC transporter permease [Chloroflexota bacterium]